MVVEDLPILENTFSEARKIVCLILITHVQKAIFNSRKQMLAKKNPIQNLVSLIESSHKCFEEAQENLGEIGATRCNSMLFGSMRTRSNAIRRNPTRPTRTECVESAQLETK